MLAGDLTDYGTPTKHGARAKELCGVACAFPLWPFSATTISRPAPNGDSSDPRRPRVCVLDGDTCEVQGVGFAGVKGFAGGFGRRALGPWGEPIIKQFVHEAVNEALKLESALARLSTEKKIVILHYAPIEGRWRGSHGRSIRTSAAAVSRSRSAATG